jgi:bisphosphoglycerate-dependent phosphoglycerate mutase
MNWQEITLTSIITSYSLFAITIKFLLPRWFDHTLSKAIETHKDQLVQKTQVLKTDLSIYAHEQNVGLSRIDSQRSEAILDLWKLFCEWHEVFISIAAPNKKLNQNLSTALIEYQKHARKLVKATVKFSLATRKYAIFFDQNTYQVIAKYGQAITEASFNFYDEVPFDDGSNKTSQDVNARFHLIKQARDNLKSILTEKKLNEYSSNLINEFRSLMKAEKNVNHSTGSASQDK